MRLFFRTLFLSMLLQNAVTAQNVIHVESLNDTLANKLTYNLLIKDPGFSGVRMIGLYKKDTSLLEPVLIKQLYVKPLDKWYLVEDEKTFNVFETEFTTKFYVYKDEYSKIEKMIFKYFSATGEQISSFDFNLYRRVALPIK